MIQCFGLLVVMWCSEPPAPRIPAVRCPPLVTYPATVQKGAAEELRRLPTGSPVRRLVTDYGDLRSRCRALEGEH